MHKVLLIVIIVSFCKTIFGQEEPPKKWSLSGYIKDLQSAFIIDNPSMLPGNTPVPEELKFLTEDKVLLNDNFLHNRLNFRWFPSAKFTLAAEARNRFFWGDQPRFYTANFEEQLNLTNDYFDLSLEGSDAVGIAYQLMLDRLYAEFSLGKWEIRAGRQRINWGISTIWNPNDLFNAYNFSDFDYEERPGSDAVRVRYFTGFASSLEIAGKTAENLNETIIAGMWKFNRDEYDYQILAGYYQDEITAGGGWAGNLGQAAFKGEFTFFKPLDDTEDLVFAGTFNIDYQFSNSLFLGGGYLYNSNGTSEGDLSSLFDLELSAKNLYPFRHAIFIQSFYPATPLLNVGGSVIYSPVEAHALFLNPTLTYSLSTNLDFDFVAQLIFNKNADNLYVSPVQALFLRLKLSY